MWILNARFFYTQFRVVRWHSRKGRFTSLLVNYKECDLIDWKHNLDISRAYSDRQNEYIYEMSSVSSRKQQTNLMQLWCCWVDFCVEIAADGCLFYICAESFILIYYHISACGHVSICWEKLMENSKKWQFKK